MEGLCRAPSAPNNLAQYSLQTCETKTAYCPNQPSKLNSTQFCEKTYPRTLGFWYHCGPTSLDICQSDSCNDQKTSPENPYFDFNNICNSFQTTYLAFQDPPAIFAALKTQKNVRIKETALADLRYISYEQDSTLWIGIQGTHNTCTWYIDLEHQKIQEPQLHNMSIHQGFLKITQEIKKDLENNVLNTSEGKTIRISGDSLGAAAAIILAMLLTEEGYPIKSVVNFGQPQITDRIGADIFNQYYAHRFDYLRVINQKDLVPHLLWVIDNSFSHFGPEMRIGKDANNQSNFALFSTPDGSPIQSEFEFSVISDHYKTNYKAHLNDLGCHF